MTGALRLVGPASCVGAAPRRHAGFSQVQFYVHEVEASGVCGVHELMPVEGRSSCRGCLTQLMPQ